MSRDINRDEDGINRGLNRRELLQSVGSVSAFGVGITGLSGTAVAASYSNPVYEPVLADPTIIQAEDGAYYAYGTEDLSTDWGGGCSETVHNPIVKSWDLIDWTHVGQTFTDSGRPSWKEGGLWAPNIAYHQGEYLFYYSLSVWGDSDPGIGVATADNPTGPFTDQGKLFRSSEIGVDNSIDPFFIVENQQPYLIWGSFHGIYGVELTRDGRDWIEDTTFHLAGNAYEGPYVIKHGGYYYLFLSTGSCCDGHNSSYEVEVGRATSITGPYHDQNGTDLRTIDEWHGGVAILSGDKRFAGPGHNSVAVDASGTEYAVYHAYDTSKPETICGGTNRRSLMIDTINWRNDWPVINNGTPSKRTSSPATSD